MAENNASEKDYCANCEESPQGRKLLQCGACKQTCYCNRDCQKNHWPFHKLRCQQIQQSRQSAIDNNQKRLRSLINEWMVESKDVMVDCLGGYFRWELIASMEKLRFAVFLKVQFDYNYNTFVPVEPPKIGPVMNGHPQVDQLHRLYDEAKHAQPPSHMRQDAIYAPVVCIISFSTGSSTDGAPRVGIQTCMVEQQLDEHVPMISFDEMVQNLKTGVVLTSKKFTKWYPLRHENTQKQLNAITQNENFRPLAANALRMFSSSPKNTTHVVKISLKEGFGLGEIASLERYELVTIQDAILEAQRKKIIVPVNGNLVESANDAVVLLSSDHICHFIMVQEAQFPMTTRQQMATIMSIADSDHMALASFCALARVQLPTIETPDLH